MPSQPAPFSFLAVEEYFAAADKRFVEALRSAQQPKQLASFVTRWQQDPRPWAREQMLRYLLLPLDSQGHQVVIKRLFKWAEKQQDTALLAHFAVAFDSLVRRVKKTRHRYDWQSRSSFQEEILHTPRNSFPKLNHPSKSQTLSPVGNLTTLLPAQKTRGFSNTALVTTYAAASGDSFAG